MILSLVEDYSSGSEADGNITKSTNENDDVKAQKVPEKILLPSAASLFADSSAISINFAVKPVRDTILIRSNNNSNQISDATSKVTNDVKVGSLRLLPPQLNRPNIVTEDLQAFSNKRSLNSSADSSLIKKGKTFQQSEKRKRDIGQTSRGKSFVEEEKRILRQSNAE